MGTFAVAVGDFVKKTGIKGDVLLRRIGLEALTGVILKSPVDTGRFRGSWRLSVGTVDTSVAPETEAHIHDKLFKKPPQGAELDQLQNVSAATFGQSIYITNNLPYGPALERGHSGQAPNGMVALTLLEIKSNLDLMILKANNGDQSNPSPTSA